jgi:hypothetical protein
MDKSHWGRVGAMLQEQHRYFNGLSVEVASGSLTAEEIAARSRMYLNAAREAFERANAIVQKEQGMDEERWVRGLTESCENCIDFEAEGWKPIDYFPMPGQGATKCLTNCGCHKEYRKAPVGE